MNNETREQKVTTSGGDARIRRPKARPFSLTESDRGIVRDALEARIQAEPIAAIRDRMAVLVYRLSK